MRLSQMTDDVNENKRNIENSYEAYKDMTHDELLRRLTSEINRQKQDGKFDYESLKSSIDRISIYLPKETYRNILKILENYK